jgi:threonylcarbamoyladenosine tRNA methylthiotransferase MtaB
LKYFLITTLGCKVNQSESEALAARLLELGWRPAGPGCPADVCIVNTCTVTGRASMQSRQAVRQLRRAHPGARVIITGCYAQTSPEEVAHLEEADLVVAQADKLAIPDLLASAYPAASRPPRPISAERRMHPQPASRASGRTRPFLKVQDGCNSFCTYCIVPFARGPSRSLPPEAVLEEIHRLVRDRVAEVVLTGIHLGGYGADLDPPTDLLDLLVRIRDATRIPRVRLSSIEPLEMSDAILDVLAADSRFCQHLHLPLQSGDDGILARMGRPYSRARFAERVQAARARLPEAALGTDVLVGFPGETQAAFEQTMALIEDLPLTHLHVFPFSPRPGTPAADYTPHIPERHVKARCQLLRLLGARKKAAFQSTFLGRVLEVLVENRRDPATGLLTGLSGNYLPVRLEGSDECLNRILPVRLESLDGQGHLRGRLLAPPH